MIQNSKDAELVSLMKAMLNYGAQAQLLFNHNTDELANASLSAADKVLPEVDANRYAYTVTGSEAGIQITQATLLLETETSVRIYFKLTGDKTIEDYTFYVNGQKVTPEMANGSYYVSVKDIAAQNLDATNIINLGGITIHYSGLSYVNTVLKNADTVGQTLVDTVKALYYYNRDAEAYFN